MNNKMNFNKAGFISFLSEAGPYIIWTASFLVLIGALTSFVLADAVVGTIFGEFITTNWYFGTFISLGTTGMTAGCVALIWFAFKQEWHWSIISFLILSFVVLQSIDMFLDSLSVDVMRYGHLVDVKTFFPTQIDKTVHILYRSLVAGISLIGEPVGMASIVMFPALKKYIFDSMKVDGVTNYRRQETRPQTNLKPNNSPYRENYKPTYQPVSSRPSYASQAQVANRPTPVVRPLSAQQSSFHSVGVHEEEGDLPDYMK